MTAALVAAVVVSVGLMLPPARQVPVTVAGDDTIAGVFHVHTNRSDGSSSPDEIAAIAARAGLRFLVFTDHGDGTRAPDPPTYRSGVLCLDAVEISTQAGHLIALGLPQTPYPLMGEARDVLEDVHRLGGMGVAAHPHSPRTDLQWRDWDAPLDGVELLNLDTEWRIHAAQPPTSGAWFGLARALATYPVRPSETIASLVSSGEHVPDQWRALASRRHLALFAGADAHARLELRDRDPIRSRWALSLPGYEAVFRTLTMRVRVSAPFMTDAERDGALLLAALREGAAYAALDAVMSPPAFELSATSGSSSVPQGGTLTTDGLIALSLTTNAPPTFTTIIWRNGEVLISQPSAPHLTVAAPAGDAIYRAEVRASPLPNTPPWILSNSLTVQTPDTAARLQARAVATATPRATTPARVLFGQSTTTRWTTETSEASRVALDTVETGSGRELQVRYGLPGGDVYGQFAAAVAATDGGLVPHAGVTFTARSDRPMRLSVQLRAPDAGDGRRWRRSVYLDSEARTYDLPFQDFREAGSGPSGEVPLAEIHGILFVVEQGSTAPGTSGRVSLTHAALQ